MLYLTFIWHMHQPYYNDLLTNEAYLPWVRMHGIKDYLDMVTILKEYPDIHQTFNLVPSLIEQINSYINGTVKDRFIILSEKKVEDLSVEEKQFIINNFFSIDVRRVISSFPRYYELYLKAKAQKDFNNQDILDLQVWFNLAWFDPDFRKNIKEIKDLIRKARYFSQEDKDIIFRKQIEILSKIIPTYKDFQDKGQIEVSISPFYHPILPLLYDTNIAKTANRRTILPQMRFEFPQDVDWHISEATKLYNETFNRKPEGMWPSEEAISKQVLPLFINNSINWIVSDESLIIKTLRKFKKERADIIYRPYLIESKNGDLNILFRDRPLSDLIGFEYQNWETEKAVEDFMDHLAKINKHFSYNDCLVVIALDGENAWEYYKNDGKDFLCLLYEKISQSQFIKTVTVSEYLKSNPKKDKLKTVASGSWIHGDFLKWIGSPAKNKAWQLLTEARDKLEGVQNIPEIALKQMHILEGSDWFWWYGDKQGQFDELFRQHLKNFYKIINQTSSTNLNQPLE